MSNVYYTKVDCFTTVEQIQIITKKLLSEIVEREKVELEKAVPMKVHFGEKGNTTFIKAENYEGIIEYLKEKGVETSYMETSVLYGGQRHRKDLHIKTALEHGFDQVPIIITDGEQGEAFSEIEINKKHYKTCKLGKGFEDYSQVIVLSHFKGHGLSGFGGAIKQLSMGFAAKGGKMAMHMGIKPKIVKRKCKRCNMCKKPCNVDAITIDNNPRIDHDKCIGCGACMSICPHKAITVFTLKGIYTAIFKRKDFLEKLVEYAYAAHHGRKNIYINFAMNITKSCDCIGKPMKPVIDDFGIFISTDPVAIDKACFDISKEKGRKFKGEPQFYYAQNIGLGSVDYRLIEI